jgi:hypothetical protein
MKTAMAAARTRAMTKKMVMVIIKIKTIFSMHPRKFWHLKIEFHDVFFSLSTCQSFL